MQDNELMPGGKNILSRRTTPCAPHRLRGDRPINPLKYLRKPGLLEIDPHFLGLFGGVRGMVMVVGEGRDDAGAELVSLAMDEFQGRHLLQMVMQQPG